MLERGTSSKFLSWEATADDNTFRLSTPTANIRITQQDGFDQEVMEPYVSRSLQILNSKGRVIEEHYYPTSSSSGPSFDNLFVLARRSAYDTDKVLDQLLADIAVKIGT